MKNPTFSEGIKQKCKKEFLNYLNIFEEGHVHILGMAKTLAIAWIPDNDDPRIEHNHYIDLLLSIYVNKYSLLSESMIHSINRNDFFSYALTGRAMIELAATLRYYLFHKYKPLLDKKFLTPSEFRTLIEIDDKHLRGGRFDWESFLFKKFDQMKENVISEIKNKKKKTKKKAELSSLKNKIHKEQYNVLTCIEKWAMETPSVMIGYNLFCDLVHPNIGSNFLVSTVEDGKLFFKRDGKNQTGFDLFVQTFPLLLSITYREMGTLLPSLALLKWQEDELS